MKYPDDIELETLERIGTKIRMRGTQCRNGYRAIVTVELEPTNSCPFHDISIHENEIKFGIEELCAQLTTED